jgi:hypothetical protein
MQANYIVYQIQRGANGLPEVVTSQELQERMDREAAQPLVMDEVKDVRE